MVKKGKITAFFLIMAVCAGIIATFIVDVAKGIPLGLDLQGGFEILYEVDPLEEGQKINDTVMDATVESLRKRVDVLGVNETTIEIEDKTRVRVQLAGIQDQSKAREILSTEARLSFRDINDVEYLNGSDIVEGSAQQSFDKFNRPNVTLKLKSADKFAEVTSKIAAMNDPSIPGNDNNVLVIWLDFEEGDSYIEEAQKESPKFISAPVVEYTINSDEVQINGDFTIEEAQELASLLNAGSLPVELNEIYSVSVGAQFGDQALQNTVIASIIGIALIFIFMLTYYRLPGLVAVVTLSIYTFLILLVFDLMNAVLTLPGIAAFVLGVGMAVDANIITYERIKEELKAGKSTSSAFKAGSSQSFGAILDANITTLIAAVVLFYFGTSTVKGFAVMLIISILVSFLTVVYGSRVLLGLWVKSKFLNNKPGWFGVKKEDIKDITKGEEVEPKVFGKYFNIIKHQNKFFTFTTILIIVGIVSLIFMKLNLGIDFTSGSRVQILADNTLTTEEVEAEFEELGLEPVKITHAGEKNEIAMVRFNDILTEAEVAKVKSHFTEIYGNDPNISTVSPDVAVDLAKNAFYAVLFASIGIIIYTAIRFEIYFAVTAIIALLHDAFFMVALFSIFQLEFDITIIAAILTIVGYSINDTIVTFDRIRENINMKKRVKSFKELAEIVNRSLMQTLTRSINTTVTTILAALMLLIFGATSIKLFSAAIVVGLVAGTYSSLFIAAQLWLIWRGKNIEKNPIQFVKKKQTGGPQV
jgi:SecD/SecF fusion protein